MNIQLFWIFVILNVVNVILQTVKSLVTIKCTKGVAALINAIAYGLYTVVVVYTVCDLPLLVKALVVAVCNLIGVWVVKWAEEKSRKDKLWKIEVTIPTEQVEKVDFSLRTIPHSYIKISPKHTLFNIYCDTQAESLKVKEIVKKYNAKYFVTEQTGIL